MKTAFFHSIGGASGDMLLGALVDAGLPVEHLDEDLRQLPLTGFRLVPHQVQRHHVTATQLAVEIDGPDDAMSPGELLARVGSSRLETSVKDQALRVLRNLLEAECRVHHTSQEELVLHQLGTMDTLIDVVGTVAGLRRLGIQKVFASPVTVGTTQPKAARAFPIPAPATLELVAMAKAALEIREGVSHEMTTPTGAALLTTLATFRLPPEISLHRVGYGAGTADLPEVPNVLAVWLGDVKESTEDGVVLLETNLDDVQGIVLGYVQERLFDEGALDVWFTPVQMKKNRPGVVLSALVPVSLQEEAVATILRETPTLGVRVRPVDRRIALRETIEFRSNFGEVRVKVKYLGSKAVAVAPEYEDCRKLALEIGMPLQELYQEILSQARAHLLA